MSGKKLRTTDSHAVSAFIEQVQKLPTVRAESGRLIFALDATASREATWDQACNLQSELFMATQDLGGLAVQLCHYRGYGEFHSSDWLRDTQALLEKMNAVTCLGGTTQIGKVLQHALKETRRNQVSAVILVLDCCEEAVDRLCQYAGELGMLRTPLFIFHEGGDTATARIFRQLCQLSGGAYAVFDHRSPARLRELLAAVAVYASGGRKALQHYCKHSNGQAQHLLEQLKP